jgi:hypothetical protein
MIGFVKYWILLAFIGYILLCFRKDSKIILNDIKRLTFDKFPYSILFIICLLFYLPFSIVYSIKNILNGN